MILSRNNGNQALALRTASNAMSAEDRKVGVLVFIVMLSYLAVEVILESKARMREVELFEQSMVPQVVKDDGRPFIFDPEVPFVLELGRGNTWHGLNPITIHSSGEMEVYIKRIDRKRLMQGDAKNYRMKANFRLSPEEIHRVSSLVVGLNLPSMHKAYRTEIADGSQWILRMTQQGRSKSVYFSNYFPAAIRTFSHELYRLVLKYENQVKWLEVPEVVRLPKEESASQSFE